MVIPVAQPDEINKFTMLKLLLTHFRGFIQLRIHAQSDTLRTADLWLPKLLPCDLNTVDNDNQLNAD
jgi:hypothetical protein